MLIKFFPCNEMDASGIDNYEGLCPCIYEDISTTFFSCLLVHSKENFILTYKVLFYNDHNLDSILLVHVDFTDL